MRTFFVFYILTFFNFNIVGMYNYRIYVLYTDGTSSTLFTFFNVPFIFIVFCQCILCVINISLKVQEIFIVLSQSLNYFINESFVFIVISRCF